MFGLIFTYQNISKHAKINKSLAHAFRQNNDNILLIFLNLNKIKELNTKLF